MAHSAPGRMAQANWLIYTTTTIKFYFIKWGRLYELFYAIDFIIYYIIIYI